MSSDGGTRTLSRSRSAKVRRTVHPAKASRSRRGASHTCLHRELSKQVRVARSGEVRALGLKDGVIAKMSVHSIDEADWVPNGLIDWGAVRKDFAGIELRHYTPGIRNPSIPTIADLPPRHGFPINWAYGWDIASGCIWDRGAVIRDIKQNWAETNVNLTFS